MSKGKRVVVVGAGPAGLFTAFGLARLGAHVTVIDAAVGINDSPRANVYLHSTIKALDNVGLLDDAKEIAALGHAFQMHFPLSGNVGTMDFRLLEGLTYPFTLHFGQNRLAELILRHFLAFDGTAMRWNTRFIGAEQSADAVQLSVEVDGVGATMDADWVIGADGARSSVRKALGIEFEGFTWPDTFMATNLYFDFEKYGYAASNMVAAGEDWHVIAKIDDQHLWRIAYGEDSDLSEEQRLARIRERYRNFLPRNASFELERANSYRVHQRSANTYRKGRVLLAGDAAHATNPIGGMGFTSGVQDAQALVRALGQLWNNEAGDDVLDFYAEERRRVFLEVANPTAIDHKRRTQRTDPAARVADEQGFIGMTRDPDAVRHAVMSVFKLEGVPYTPDWRAGFQRPVAPLAAG
ncbi:FAD-dependent oxidoreductase [Massilia dura]|uniref:FAD-dependent oxidoreductase n=1 Tax=Pseudoduganella dura TaxID=321982 RepID=A0A6I3XDQ5_9BURK|nr:NAD(P)/FAD-dependent oxidoreductase [Pseudoduganella dura]MUI11352.1 FAD-dependent oxidoreductase [Pseudoduganella dura]GGX95597.1 hypothetical protein GCM10007386_28110 [Pseudoduganella dura]